MLAEDFEAETGIRVILDSYDTAEETIARCESLVTLDPKTKELYSDYWKKVKADGSVLLPEFYFYMFPAVGLQLVAAAGFFIVL